MEEATGSGFSYGFGHVPITHPTTDHLLTAIDRFLWSSLNDIWQPQSSSNDELVSLLLNSGTMNGISLPSSLDQDLSFVDGLFVGGNSCNNFIIGEKISTRRVIKGVGGSSSSSPTNFIKGQWSDEEDRLLVTLVEKYGVRKWAQIAQKLVGRAGKQCRERWHNHLRPDIKKDTWSEEEEILLIESHEKLGNRWAEIAKRIPGRTENTIKNHWNATKRRLNSRRKSNKKSSVSSNQRAKSQPSILQEYINSKNLKETSSSSSSISTTSTSSFSTDPSNVPIPEPSSYDDEIPFVENFYENIYNQLSDDHNNVIGYSLDYDQEKTVDSSGSIFDYSSQFINSTPHPNTNLFYTNNNTVQKDQDQNTCNENATTTTTRSHLYSDLYISYLLNGSDRTTTIASTYFHENPNFDLMMMTNDESPYNGYNKEMDLIEMVSSTTTSSNHRL